MYFIIHSIPPCIMRSPICHGFHVDTRRQFGEDFRRERVEPGKLKKEHIEGEDMLSHASSRRNSCRRRS
jgi:hypothetical protein